MHRVIGKTKEELLQPTHINIIEISKTQFTILCLLVVHLLEMGIY
jgi:hypothetical protein